MNTYRRASGFLYAFVVLLCVAALIAFVATGNQPARNNTISVTGTATASGTPDTAAFSIGVTTTAASASSALAKNNRQTRSLEATLFRSGVTKANLQTSGLSIYPATNNNGQVTGFTVSDNLVVTMHNMKKVGTAIDAAANAVGNDVTLSGITFSLSNDSGLLASARSKAIRSAHTIAAQLASAANESLGSALKITDQENQSTSTIVPYANDAVGSSVPVQAGSQQVSVSVSVTYALG
jgi:uncharacterized protein